jgi:hypothetical protein
MGVGVVECGWNGKWVGSGVDGCGCGLVWMLSFMLSF